MTAHAHDGAAGRRTAGILLIVAGGLFLAVVTYLFGVLLPLGLSFDLLDQPGPMLDWMRGHLAAYTGLYGLYLAQQLVLLVGVVALTRAWRAANGGGTLAGDVAAVAGVLSVALAVVSIGVLVMAARSGAGAWPAATADQRFSVLTTYEAVADVGKGARLLSELLLGWWLVWLGVAQSRAGGSRAFLATAALGVWTGLVGVWKLVDPFMPLEDWLAFVVAAGLAATGVGMLRSSR